MRILRLISSMNPTAGGPCQGIRNLLPELEKRGVRQEVVSLDDPGASFIQKDKFPIHALGPSKSSWAYSSRLKPWLEQNLGKYNVVIQHGLWQNPGYALLQARRKLAKSGEKVPRLYIYPHGMLDPWFQKAESRRLKAVRNWIYWKLIENRVIAAADGLLFTCEEELRLAATTFSPYRPKAVHNVGYGIPEPPGNIEAQRAAFAETFPNLVGRPFLLFLSRIHPKKGVDLLLRAYAQVKEEFPNLPPLIIAGPCADRDCWNSLQSLAISLGIQSELIPYESVGDPKACDPPPMTSIIWSGMLQDDRKWGTLRAASAFILPSHQENFGIAVVEAQAVGTPVMISNKVNIWREIHNAKAGLVKDDNLTGTIDLVRQFAMNGMSALTRSGEACFRKHFHIEVASRRLTDTLSNSLS